MGERKNWSNVLHLKMRGEYDAVPPLPSSILRQRPLSQNNRQWKRNMMMSRVMVLILLTPLEDVIRLAISSMCHSNAAGQESKKNG
jgi:hypothetical protein